MTTYTKHTVTIGQFEYTFTSWSSVTGGGGNDFFDPLDPHEVEVERIEFDSAKKADGTVYDDETYPYGVEEAEKLIWLFCQHNPDVWERVDSEVIENYEPEFYED